MSFDLPKTLDIVERTPSVLGALLRGTSVSWHAVGEGPGARSALDVPGHLSHGGETDRLPRARIILKHGPTPGEVRSFEPFNRFAQLTRFAGWPLDRPDRGQHWQPRRYYLQPNQQPQPQVATASPKGRPTLSQAQEPSRAIYYALRRGSVEVGVGRPKCAPIRLKARKQN